MIPTKRKAMDHFIEKIHSYIEEKQLIHFGDHLIIGLSGGADSVCLLLALEKLKEAYGLLLTAVHVHHGIRGESAKRDLLFSKKLCEQHGIEFAAEYRDVPKIAQKRHLTEEEAGRSVRYEIFEQEAKKRGADVIAVAHHMDDQAETVLMNLLRGSGVRGCCGILAKRALHEDSSIRVVRPLLCVRRSEIEAWLCEKNQSWCTDETNLETEYLRSRIRNNLLPLLEREYNAQSTEHLFRAAGDFQEAEEFIRSQAIAIFAGWEQTDKDSIRIPIKELSEQRPIMRRYLIQEALNRLGGLKNIQRTHIESVLSLLEKHGGRRIMLPNGRQARLEYDFVMIERCPDKGKRSGEKNESQGMAVYSIFPVCEKKIPQNCCVNWFDYDTIKKGLLMRKRRPGDRICIDSRGNTQKLSDCMINAKIPADRRDEISILASGNEVLWVVGHRMAQNCRITESTRLVLEVLAEKS